MYEKEAMDLKRSEGRQRGEFRVRKGKAKMMNYIITSKINEKSEQKIFVGWQNVSVGEIACRVGLMD